MKKFKKIWAVVVVLMTLAFIGYCVMEHMKEDSSGPVISGGGDRIEVSIFDGEEVLLQGITAKDQKDGDVTASLMVEKFSSFYDRNTRMVTLAAFDSDNHISKVQREVVYTDYQSPRFELTGSLRFRAGETVNIDKIVKASDCLDGDVSNKIKIHLDTTINNRVTGFYTVTYEINNSAGDFVSLPIAIEVYEPYNNEVTLNLDRYLVYYDGEPIPYEDYLYSIRKGNLDYAFEGVELTESQKPTETPADAEDTEATEDAEETATSQKIPKSRVRISDEVDYEAPGVYPVYYYYTEETERYTSEAKEVLYVVVE